jgi:hypothetical protein
VKLKTAIWILWPSFLVAIIAEGLVFSLFKPEDLLLFGQPHHLSNEAIYSIGFFVFWGLCAISSGLSLFIVRDCFVTSKPSDDDLLN